MGGKQLKGWLRLMATAMLWLFFVSPGPDSVQARPAFQQDADVIVRITDLQPGRHVRGAYVLRGYAADRRSPDGPGLNSDDIQIYMNDTSLTPDPRNLVDYADANQESPAAAAELGTRFARAGFTRTLELCSFPAGPQTITVWASSRVRSDARNYATMNLYVDSCDEGTIMRREGALTMPVQDSADFPPTPGVYRDFAAGVDARCTESVDCNPGLIFRRLREPSNDPTNSSYYRFSVRPSDGQFLLAYRPGTAGQQITDLIPWTSHPVILRGTAANRLAVIAHGDSIRLFVNGQQVGEVRDGRRDWGHIGLIAETTVKDHVAVVEFDNLVISTPGPPELLEAVGAPTSSAARPQEGELGRILFRDDFANPSSGWPQETSDPTTWWAGYGNGEYVLRRLERSGAPATVNRVESYSNFFVQVDARLLPPTTDSYLFLGFRRQLTGDYYRFVVDPNDTTFLLARIQNGNAIILVDWTPTTAIRLGGEVNRLGVWAQGDQIALRINGQEVMSVEDSAFEAGALVLGVSNYNDDAAEARFSDLVVSAVD